MKAVTKVLVVSLLAVGCLWVAGSALAQYPPPPDCPNPADPACVLGNVDTSDPEVLPNFIESDPGVLAVTGADLTLFVVMGGSAILVGTILVRRFRSTRST